MAQGAIVMGLLIGVVLVLIVAVRSARGRRRPQVRVNGVLEIEVDRGSRLMAALTEKGVYLPGTCGGKGACAQCKCQVLSGGGTIGGQEIPYFDPKAIQDHWRLACQVVVWRDMDVRVPPEALPQQDRPVVNG